MDRSKFSSKSPGTLVKVETTWGPDHAFVPDELPPKKWKVRDHLWELLASANKQVGILEGLGRVLPNPAILLRPLADREAIQSSRLEGTHATPKELLLFELDSGKFAEPKRRNDQLEVFNYRRALNHGAGSELPISLRLIRELHGILLKGVRGKDKSPGYFRKIQVGIGARGRFIPPPADRLTGCLHPLETYCNEPSRFDPIINAFLVHYQFESIHPFIDGNGRVGRLLLAIMLQQSGLSKPWLYMSEFFEANKDEYVDRLFAVSTKADWSGWIEFCLQGTIQQAEETLARCETLRTIREDFMKRISQIGGQIRLAEIVESIFHSPFIRIAELPDKLDISYPTAKSDVGKLVEAEILSELPDVYPKTFYSPEVFNVAYDELD